MLPDLGVGDVVSIGVPDSPRVDAAAIQSNEHREWTNPKNSSTVPNAGEVILVE